MSVSKLHRRTSRPVLSLLALSLLPLAGHGEVLDLAATVVSATSTEKTLKDAPASISVITAEELAKRPVRDLHDALRGSEGLQFNSIGLTRRGISIRGMSSEHTLILLDGRRISPASGAIAHADFDLGWIPVEAIERIEVVRGPMSSLYGSEALGGVVNVITRRATDHWRGNFMAEGGVREDDLGGQAHQFGGYVGGPLLPGVLGLTLNADSHRRQETPDFDRKDLSEIEGRDAASGGATLTWTPGSAQRIDFTHARGRERRWRHTESGGPGSPAYESRDVIEREQWSLSHSGDWQWGSSQVRAYRNQLDRSHSRNDGRPANTPQRLTDTVLDGHLGLSMFDMHQLTFGGEWRREELEDRSVNRLGKEQALHRALFLQDEIAFGPDWSLTLGSRFDLHEQYGWQSSPRVYLLHHVNDALSLRAGVGEGFKAPSLKQLSPEYAAVGGGGMFTIVGNPDLKPETSTAYELGMDYRPGNWFFNATLFQSDVEDLIQTVCVADCGIRGRELRNYENVEQARLRGLELGSGTELGYGLSWKLNYTYLDARNRTQGQRLGDRSRHLANSTLQWNPIAGFEARLRTEYIGSQVAYKSGQANGLPAYRLWHLDFSQQLTRHLTLRGGIENIGDERLADRSENFNYAEPGRTFHIGLMASF